MICGVTMGEIGSESCECCVSHRRCYAYKVAKEKRMAQSSEAFLKLMRSGNEADRRRIQMGKEKNPKQVLIDWVQNVENTANNLRDCLKSKKMTSSYSFEREGALDVASDYVYDILGQCKAMMTVLNNSD